MKMDSKIPTGKKNKKQSCHFTVRIIKLNFTQILGCIRETLYILLH